jgi:sugar phosphate isomerase/epimerase
MQRETRREFFQQLAATTLAITGVHAISRNARASADRRRFTLDLRCGSIGVRANQKQAIALASKYGFESVAPSGAELARLSESELQQLLGELEAAQLVWGAAGLPVDFRRDDARFDEGMRQLKVQAAALQRAGVTRISTWLSPRSDTLTYVANFRLHTRRLRQIAKVAADHGLRFGLEYVGPKTSWTGGRYSFVHSMAETKDLIAEIGERNVGFVLDSWHWYTAGETVDDLRTLSNDQIVACDLNDAPAGIPVDEQIDNRRELPAATGVIDLAAFLSALVEIGYDGPVRAEPFNQELQAMDDNAAVAATAAAMKKAFALVE